jgi:hypothetical protein
MLYSRQKASIDEKNWRNWLILYVVARRYYSNSLIRNDFIGYFLDICTLTPMMSSAGLKGIIVQKK